MSEARERLIERVTQATLDGYGPEGQVNAVLRSPDDLIAVLVEAGVLDTTKHYGHLCYRRTEENTR